MGASINSLHELESRPKILQDSIFDRIFHMAEIANYKIKWKEVNIKKV